MMQPVSSPREPQSAGAVLMVRPAHFAFNPETAASNALSSARPPGIASAWTPAGVQAAALREFDALAAQLQGAGVEVCIAEDTEWPVKPDALFPNNWVSFHRDGTVVLYPMLAPNRRWERRPEVLERLVQGGGYRTTRTVDLSGRETQGRFLEGTGSLVLDRENHVAYASLSPRTDPAVLGEFGRLLDYEVMAFEAFDRAAAPIYHTNVLMAIGAGFAVLCGEAIADAPRRGAIRDRLRATGRDLIEISRDQMLNFAANLLELTPASGPVIALSRTAWRSLDASQQRQLERQGSVLTADVGVIEGVGGGGVRCMLAEIHLPQHGPRPAP